ncbi:TonB-dependent receptor [Sphingomonas carotinifaciens]|uniref:TonB-dependent receptor n=2 Tax=Sphingomonas carotinifaciens TaxID=1166323 RepID=A0A1G7MJM1_9SPHN|nr:TonB-dependent receptor [Sphingomonas carotinifaciens]MBB4086808.1 TonB-dependent receptor [Sphingomonas carotinifaciens]SDF61359.1 TonB-dependent receptor [Sphingomonas carotinifaciens]
MKQFQTRDWVRVTMSLGVSTWALTAAAAVAQVANPVPTPAGNDTERPEEVSEPDIVVTGFRAALNSALNQKRRETAAVDSIVADDIGKFPDSNLAESMQRIPGVALARGDGGEGRNISVRGLGAAFTRVRINGMEGTAQTGSSDIYGAGNNGRSFDFNVFPTEIFSALSVRKTPSADVEDGSLGATVDLNAPKPLDNNEDFVLTATARGIYNELSKKVDPRASLLVSKSFADGTFGVLASGAYQKRHLREVGYSAVDILSANTNGGFCSPVGFAPVNPAVGNKGATATLCSTGNPRTSTVAAYQTIQNLRRADLPNTPGSGAFLPRLPRYLNSEQDQERIGGTVTFQFKPDDATDISLDLLYSRFEVTRRDNYIAGISFGRSIANNGQPMVSVRDIAFDGNGSLVNATFDGVDVRSEGLVDNFVSTFKQANLNFKRSLTDTLEVSGLVGLNQSIWDGRKRLQTFMDVIDSDNFTLNARNGSTPAIGFGFDVADPNNYSYAPSLADGTVLGGFSYQGKPSKNDTKNLTGEVNVAWKAGDDLTIKAGGQYRESDFLSTFLRPFNADTVVRALPAGTTLASITRQVTGVGGLWGNGAPDSWAAIDPDKWAQTFGFDAVRYCGVECGGGRSRVREEIKSAYIMGTFDLGDRYGVGLRGDVGVRYVKTDMRASGIIAVAPPAGVTSPTNLVGQYAVAYNAYDDWLPSVNFVVEPVQNLLVRLSAAKVLARPELGLLTPTSGVNPITRVGNINNPFLDPIRADTFDAAVEWYFRPGSLLSVAYFRKNIKSFIQNVNSQIPFNQLGLPNALLENSNTAPDELFTVSQPFNTPGGPLEGVELNAQVPLTFLPGFLRNFGFLANYTRVTSTIRYILASVNGVPTVTTTADLVGLSKNTASGTLYYEDDRFSIRSTANYRDRFIRGIPASPGSDLQGNAPTLYVDASASYNLTDRIKLIVEAQNLTDEQNRLYTDSVRQDTLFETRIGRTVTVGVTFRL